jgi:hypothetical protein
MVCTGRNQFDIPAGSRSNFRLSFGKPYFGGGEFRSLNNKLRFSRWGSGAANCDFT